MTTTVLAYRLATITMIVRMIHLMMGPDDVLIIMQQMEPPATILPRFPVDAAPESATEVAALLLLR